MQKDMFFLLLVMIFIHCDSFGVSYQGLEKATEMPAFCQI